MTKKPKAPYSPFARRILRKILPNKIYRTYVGRHEDMSMKLWEILSREVESGKAVLDIGAFHGVFSLLTRKVNARIKIFAFEPSPPNFEILRQKVEGQNITIECLAMAESSGQVSFQLNQAMSYMVAEPDEDGKGDVVAVKAETLDDWVARKQVSPGLIKLDTEGMEAFILKSSQKTLVNHEPIFHCEVLSDDAGMAVMAQLPSNYRYFHIDENKGISLRKVIDRKKWRNHNWLLVPSSKEDHVKRLCRAA